MCFHPASSGFWKKERSTKIFVNTNRGQSAHLAIRFALIIKWHQTSNNTNGIVPKAIVNNIEGNVTESKNN